MPGPLAACVFDAYGTLFDVAAAARALAAERPAGDAFAERWTALAETWRRKQLEYSWLRAAAGRHRPFGSVTADALDYALEAQGLDRLADAAALRARLIGLYQRLGAFPEAKAALAALKAEGRATAILSNGDPQMLGAAVAAAEFGALLDAVLSVESVGVFKPHPDVYALATERFDCAPKAILFVSSNGWDVCSAAAYGFRTVWINRRGEPVDRLDARPDRIAPDLSTLPALAAELESAL